MRCPACQHDAPDDARFCPRCAASLGDPTETARSADPTAPTETDRGAEATRTVAEPTRTVVDGSATERVGPSRHTTSLPGGEPATSDRFVPGDLVADRYRIVGLLGRGGMGEVYRADDLRLGRPVALKFLPVALETNRDRLRRFLDEARVALEVTHPNVCRVYDLGETDGRHYLSMEFVDGENLASLLRRVGRVPEDRAVEIARQLCAGLAAAHDLGILHRDLKPANVMLDGRGRVKITDFGLAGLAEGFRGREIRAGTPQYMSPEQLDGREVTVRSDVYALGLVLYELFTGRPAFASDSLEELKRMHREVRATSPTRLVSGFDRVVEAAILRCLEKNPEDRPASALAVSAMLPGGDPLAAALAAGQTPSPEMVAEATAVEALAPGVAFAAAAGAVILALVAGGWMARFRVETYLPLDKPPAALVDRAEEILASAGYTEPLYAAPADRAHGFVVHDDVVDEVGAHGTGRTRYDALRDRPEAVGFWYRQAPRPMVPKPGEGRTFASGPVRPDNPAGADPGWVEIGLDGRGRLTRFLAYPAALSDPSGPGPEPDWTPFLVAAGLDPATLEPVAPRITRPFEVDWREARIGVHPERPDLAVRVEAGATDGRVSRFEVLPRATVAALDRAALDPPARPSTVVRQTRWLVLFGLVGVAFVLAWRNLASGRGDRRGAARIAATVGAIVLVSEVLRSHALFGPTGAGILFEILATILFYAAVVAAVYLTVEPFGRRVWPQMFVSSGRLLSRPTVRFRDALTGRAVLAGVAAGGAVRLLVAAGLEADAWLRGAPSRPIAGALDVLVGQREAFGTVLAVLKVSITFALVQALLLVIARALVRRAVPAIALASVLWGLLVHVDGSWEVPWITVAVVVVQMLVLLRYGLLASLVALPVFALSSFFSIVDWRAWSADAAWFSAAIVVLLAAYGAWAATGGRRRPASLAARSTGSVTAA